MFGQGADYNSPIVNPQSVVRPNPYVPAFNLLTGPPVPANPPVGANGRYPLPEGISINAYTYPLNSYRIPSVYFWNLAVQHQFTSDLALEVAYVGNVGRHLFEALNENQAIPGPGNYDPRRPFYQLYGINQGIYQYCNCGNSNYNALQTKLQKRFSRGFDFQLTCSWSKALDDNEGGSEFGNNYNTRPDYGPAAWDREHVVTFQHNWDLPFGKNRHWALGNNAIANAVLGGWRLSGVHTFETGMPFSATVQNAPLLNADFIATRADIIGNPNVSHPNANLWFNPAAFTEPSQPYRNGTSGRNILRGPKLWESDLSLAKNLLSSERRSLELRADAFNVFNHVNLGMPSSTVDAQGAGQITSIQLAMRQMQFGLHFQF